MRPFLAVLTGRKVPLRPYWTWSRSGRAESPAGLKQSGGRRSR